MAYKNDGQNPAQRRISYNMGTFFSSEKNGNEYQMVKVGFYNESLTLNFYKGTSGASNQQQEAFVKFEYEASVALKTLIEQLVRARVSAYREGKPYQDYWINYDLVFIDRDTREPRKAGSLTVKTDETTKGHVALIYTNGVDEFRVVLGATFLPSQLTQVEAIPMDIDIKDSRFYAFAENIASSVRHWPLLVQHDKVAQITLNRLQSICDKLGVNTGGPGQGDGGRYSSGSYRSKSGGGDRPAVTDQSSDDAGSYSDEPF